MYKYSIKAMWCSAPSSVYLCYAIQNAVFIPIIYASAYVSHSLLLKLNFDKKQRLMQLSHA